MKLPHKLKSLRLSGELSGRLWVLWTNARRFENWEDNQYGQQLNYLVVRSESYKNWLLGHLSDYAPEIQRAFVADLTAEAKRKGYDLLAEALTDVIPEPPPALIFERLFATPERMEKTLAALRDLGITDAGNRWIFGEKKAAIMALISVLKLREWFLYQPPDVELAQCMAAFLGTEIGQSTVYDYATGPPKYAAGIVSDLAEKLPKE